MAEITSAPAPPASSSGEPNENPARPGVGNKNPRAKREIGPGQSALRFKASRSGRRAGATEAV